MTDRIKALLFDKDGTLFSFAETWDAWAIGVIETLSSGDPVKAMQLAVVMRFDLSLGRFRPDSPVIAGTNAEVAALIHSVLQDRPLAELERFLTQEAEEAPLSEAVPLVPLLAMLAAQDLSLGVMTNDHESVARAQLGQVGVLGMFDFVAGADSGFGAKPDPGPLLAFAHATGHAPHEVVMVGDSTHDLLAGRAAGMGTVGVLTGLARRIDLAPHADVVLPNIGHLPGWLLR